LTCLVLSCLFWSKCLSPCLVSSRLILPLWCLTHILAFLIVMTCSICICFDYKLRRSFCILWCRRLLLVLPSCVWRRSFMCRDKRHLQPWDTWRPHQREVVGTIGLLWPSQQGGRWSQLITKVQGQGDGQGEGQDVRVSGSRLGWGLGKPVRLNRTLQGEESFSRNDNVSLSLISSFAKFRKWQKNEKNDNISLSFSLSLCRNSKMTTTKNAFFFFLPSGSPTNSNDTRLTSGEDRVHNHSFQVEFEIREAQYRYSLESKF
jgi:hypothetical protein